ncbi:hypothetical protein Pmar_PMAR019155 [Perkinsus marinus ATCC 50983]|uniref:Uncharacterized protein n=1 Tax=Perkinsus marinus (strain ATCC 50983 / TXsc) TaxID=423536 RepID=C5KU07_PERM5|nr:hypothetical protein Pmar_PMAR019155 [Perkinsus marinus ATCC 50983]EER12049.1 hypothetical protein Pmar_PMAR019155 [Perkinsus marinus ATCC 50983]|eukprot:XP_002780254.1 hypothetical protein Pmar_PMAR019155 [Perkinsus marinus ATCC 50983]
MAAPFLLGTLLIQITTGHLYQPETDTHKTAVLTASPKMPSGSYWLDYGEYTREGTIFVQGEHTWITMTAFKSNDTHLLSLDLANIPVYYHEKPREKGVYFMYMNSSITNNTNNYPYVGLYFYLMYDSNRDEIILKTSHLEVTYNFKKRFQSTQKLPEVSEKLKYMVSETESYCHGFMDRIEVDTKSKHIVARLNSHVAKVYGELVSLRLAADYEPYNGVLRAQYYNNSLVFPFLRWYMSIVPVGDKYAVINMEQHHRTDFTKC